MCTVHHFDPCAPERNSGTSQSNARCLLEDDSVGASLVLVFGKKKFNAASFLVDIISKSAQEFVVCDKAMFAKAIIVEAYSLLSGSWLASTHRVMMVRIARENAF